MAEHPFSELTSRMQNSTKETGGGGVITRATDTEPLKKGAQKGVKQPYPQYRTAGQTESAHPDDRTYLWNLQVS